MEAAIFKSEIVDDPRFAEFTRFVATYKFGDPVTPLFMAGESFVNCEILHRRAERAKALKLSKGEYYEEMAMIHNDQGLSRLRAARASVNKAIEMFPRVIEKEDELVSEREMKDILDRYGVIIKNEVFEMDLPAEDAKAVWAEYVQIKKTVDEAGMSGLINYYGSKIDELIKARTDLKAGRKLASPLSWWKICFIAGCLAVSVGAVVYCYKKHNCGWVWYLVRAIGGFVYDVLRAGC